MKRYLCLAGILLIPFAFLSAESPMKINMKQNFLKISQLHDIYKEWAGDPVKIYNYRKKDTDEHTFSELDILCYQSEEEDELTDDEHMSFLVTAGMSNHKMNGPIEYAELFLQIKGKKYFNSLDEVSKKLAEFAAIPFRHNTYFSPNRIIDDFTFPLFSGMDSVLLTNCGVNSPEYLPYIKKRILLIQVNPIFETEAQIIEKIGDIEANDRFLSEGIDWFVPDRNPAKLV